MVETLITKDTIKGEFDTLMIKGQCDIVVLGHVNVGKSTLCGRILLDSKMVDIREIDRLKNEA